MAKLLICSYTKEGAFTTVLPGGQESLLNYDGNPCDPDIATYVSAVWNEDYFFCRFDGLYKSIRTAEDSEKKTEKTMRLWEKSDVFEMFISPEKNRVYREFQVGPDGKFLDIAIDSSNENRISDFNWNSKMTNITEAKNNLWQSTMKIPWSAFKNSPPVNNEEWTVNFYRISEHYGQMKYLSWAPVFKIAFHQPELFGKIRFRKQV